MLARCIARRVTRLRTTRALSRGLYEFAPGRHTTFEESGIPPLYQPPPGPEETLTGWELKSHLTAEADFNEPELDDEGVLQFYRAMVYSGSEGLIESVSEVVDVKSRIRGAERRRMISSMVARLDGLKLAEVPQPGPAPNTIDQSPQTVSIVEAAGPSNLMASTSSAQRPSLRVLDILGSLHIPQSFDNQGIDAKGKGREILGPILPLGLLSVKEWQALFEDSMSHKDVKSAERVLTLMGQHGFPPVQAWAEKLVNAYAKTGDTDAVDRFNMQMTQVFADAADYQTTAMTAILNRFGHGKAISVLKQHENDGTPLAQKAYQVVLHHLSTGSPTHRPNSHSRALARDLFAHMRLAAHPVPDRELYRDMIAACAAPSDPQPERARDLWLEMTSEGDTPAVEPEKEDYNAIIRALCTSKDDYFEGFDIFRQMLSKHQDAVRIPFDDIPRATFSKYIPDLKTFSALLQGTKRVGDLEKTRWLLLEMVKLVQAASLQTSVEIAGPDASVLADVFQAYATWTPPPPVLLRTKETSESVEPEPEMNTTHELDDPAGDYRNVDLNPLRNPFEQGVEAHENSDTVDHYTPSPLPQTHAEALREASTIWERLLYDVKAAHTGQVALIEFPFSQVWLDQRVVTAYQSVILRHVWDISKAKELWELAFKQANEARGVPWASEDDLSQAIAFSDDNTHTTAKTLRPNGFSYTEALEYCAYPPKMHQLSPERRHNPKRDWVAGMAWAQELWEGYTLLLDGAEPIRLLALGEKNLPTSPPQSTTQPDIIVSSSEARAWLHNFGLGDRQVEKAYKAMIRTYASAGQPLEGLEVLLDFRRRFPPKDITDTYRPIPRHGLNMRVEDPTSLAEPNVPPALTWNDLSNLHEALVKALRDELSEEQARRYEKGLASVKNLSKAYEAGLFQRRRWRMRNYNPDRDSDPKDAERNLAKPVAETPQQSQVTYIPAQPSRLKPRNTTHAVVRPTAAEETEQQDKGTGPIPGVELEELQKIIAMNSPNKYKLLRASGGKPRAMRAKRDVRPERPIKPVRSGGFGKRPVPS